VRRGAIGLLVVLACLGAIAARALSGAPREPAPTLANAFAVKRGALRITLDETGTLKTKTASTIRSGVEGSAKIAFLIDEGAAVKSGDVLVELDQTEVKEKIEELERNRIQGESELDTASSELEVQEAQAKTDLEKAELRVDVARVAERKLKEGDIPKELKTRQLRIEKATSALQRAEEKYKTMPDLQKLGFVTKSQVEEERLKVEEAKVELDAAKQDMDLYTRFQQPLDTKTKEAEVGEAERELERTKSRTAALTEEKRAIVLQRELTLKATFERLAREKKRRANMTLRAPKDGIVVYGDPDQPWRSEEIKVGASVYENGVLCTIPDTSELAVALQVHEAEIDKLKLGLKATVTLETYKGVVLHGEVSKIAAIAISGGWRDEVKKFAVDVAIIESHLNLRTGITAKAEIEVTKLPEVLHVPLQAVHVKDGKHRCFVRSGGAVSPREVEIGAANDDFVEVKKGLSEGETVLLYDPSGESETSK
jgi:HlyD family secretion protein